MRHEPVGQFVRQCGDGELLLIAPSQADRRSGLSSMSAKLAAVEAVLTYLWGLRTLGAFGSSAGVNPGRRNNGRFIVVDGLLFESQFLQLYYINQKNFHQYFYCNQPHELAFSLFLEPL